MKVNPFVVVCSSINQHGSDSGTKSVREQSREETRPGTLRKASGAKLQKHRWKKESELLDKLTRL